jgi:hypothetical protein
LESSKDVLDNISTYQRKIKIVKESLKGWGANLEGNMKKEKANLIAKLAFLESLEEENTLSGDQYTRKSITYENL